MTLPTSCAQCGAGLKGQPRIITQDVTLCSKLCSERYRSIPDDPPTPPVVEEMPEKMPDCVLEEMRAMRAFIMGNPQYGVNMADGFLYLTDTLDRVRHEIRSLRSEREGYKAELYDTQKDLQSSQQRAEQQAKELMAWHWLHWGHPTSWACHCGNANGHAVDRCDDCGMNQPRSTSRTET